MERRASSSRRDRARLALAAAGLCLLAFAGVRLLALMLADHWAEARPDRALALVESHPVAALASARRQLAEGDAAAATATARALLAREPAQGGAYAVLARARLQEGDTAGAARLMRIAARRSPRDMAVRGWLAEHDIARGDHAAGLLQLEAIMRLSPRHVDLLVPMLAVLAEDPAFARALDAQLRQRPRWAGMVEARIAQRAGSAGAGRGLVVPAPVQVRVLALADRVAALVDPRGLVPAGR